MASIHDVAKLAGVGTTTVSRVINKKGYVSQEALEKVNKAIAELNYTPSQLGKNLKAKNSKTIGLFIPTICHPFFSKIAYLLEDELYKKGYRLLLVNSQGNPEKEIKLLNMIPTGQVDGIIYITYYQYKMDLSKLPIVTLDRHIEGVPCITSDNYESSKKALYYLRKEGCKNIAFIGGKAATPSETNKRFIAYQDFCKETGNPIKYFYDLMLHGEEKMIAKTFIDANKEIDGLFTASDLFANACYQIYLEKGIKVPDKVKIVSFDGVLNDLIPSPSFTVVKQRVDEIAKELVRVLLLRIDNKETNQIEYIPSEFVIGETA